MESKIRALKILYVVTEDWYFCSHRLNLAKAAQDRGFEIHVATRVHNCSDKILAAGFTLHRLSQLKRASVSPWQELLAAVELWRLYRRVRPDIVHHVALKPVLYGSLIGRLLKVKIIVNALGGVGSLFLSRTPKMRGLQKLMIFLLRPLLNQKNQKLIVQNQEDYNLWSDQAKVSEAHLILIPGSGVDIEHFKQNFHAPNRPPLIVCAARMLLDKGVGELIEASKILKQRHLQFRLILCGAIDAQNPSAIDQTYLLKGQEEGVFEWLGHVEDMASIYQNADIAVLASYREGLPKTLLEAAACGLPIVTTNVPGCRDVVCHQVNGLLVSVRNAGALAEALEVLIKDESLRQVYGKAGRLRAESEFADALIIDQTLALYV